MKTIEIPSGSDLGKLYRENVGDYPKFFKMDTACKLGFLLAELLVKDEPNRFVPRKDRAVLVFSRSGSLADDKNYAASMEDFPSPALFVYTLPNPVTGEIAIRNKYAGETSAFVLESFNPEQILDQIVLAFQDTAARSVLAAWIDCPSDEEWTARGWLIDWRDLVPPEEEHHCCHGGGHGGGCCGKHHHEDGEEHHCHCKENNKEQ